MTFERQTYELAPLDVFASPSELAAAIGGSATGAAHERRLAVALLLATRHVLDTLGYTFDDAPVPADPAPLVVQVVDVSTRWRQATVAAAVRFYKSPDVPFGVAGGWDMATYVRMSIPDVDLILVGERVAFGVA